MIVLVNDDENAVKVSEDLPIYRQEVDLDDIVHVLKGGILVIRDYQHSTVITLRNRDDY